MGRNRVGGLWATLIDADDALPDAALLGRFAAGRDAAAFALLVRRHGPLVLGVCRRTAGHAQDAEDAFQAVFLILANKAGAIRDPDRLANWLFGTAYRVARRAKRAAARRRKREVQPRELPDVPAAAEVLPEANPAVDAALAALPEWYRVAVLLCDVEGVPRAAAAGRLGIPEGTLSSRLAKARRLLADKLSKRGVTLAAAGLTLTVTVPDALAHTAAGVAAGGSVTATAAELALTGGSFMRILLLAAAATATLMGVGVGVAAWPQAEGPKPPPDAKPLVRPPDPDPALGPVPDPAAEPKPAKPADAPGDFTTKPTLRAFLDVPGECEQIFWSGKPESLLTLVMRGSYNGERVAVFIDPSGNPPIERGHVTIPRHTTIMDVSAAHKRIVQVHRDSARISSVYRLEVYDLTPGAVRNPGDAGPPPGMGAPGTTIPRVPRFGMSPRRIVALDPDRRGTFAFAPDGKTVLGLTWAYANSNLTDIALAEMADTDTGDRNEPPAWKALAALKGPVRHVTLAPAVRGFFAADDEKNFRFEAAGPPPRSGRIQLDAVTTKPEKGPDLQDRNRGGSVSAERMKQLAGFSAIVSRDGLRAVFNQQLSSDAPTAAFMNSSLPGGMSLVNFRGDSSIEPLKLGTRSTLHSFSADGRLIAYSEPVSRAGNSSGYELTVYDTQAKAVVKVWPAYAMTHFAPDGYRLAVVEKTEQGMSRVGFWDFAK